MIVEINRLGPARLSALRLSRHGFLAIYKGSANIQSHFGEAKGDGMRGWPPKQKDLEFQGINPV